MCSKRRRPRQGEMRRVLPRIPSATAGHHKPETLITQRRLLFACRAAPRKTTNTHEPEPDPTRPDPIRPHHTTPHTMFAANARRTVLRAAGAAGAPRAPSVFASYSAYHRLLSTLAILEQREGALNHGSLSAFTAAKKLGGPIHGFIAGSNIKPVAAEAAKVDGVEKIIAVDNVAYDKVRSSSPTHRPRGFRPPAGPRR